MKPLRTITDFLNAYDARSLLPEDVNDHTARAVSAAKLPDAKDCFIHLNEQSPDQAERAIASGLPLGGIAIHVKDNFDVAGQVTTAGSKVLHGQPPATHDATVISRLKSAGAVILGRTNMTEFAYSGIGMNPHYGSPPCAADRLIKRVSGGSTSGGAVAIALNIGWASIGTDTGGSVRIPAALNGVVGWKPTAQRLPMQGCYPLSPSLDSVGIITRNVADVLLIDDIVSSTPMQWQERTCKGMRFVVPEQVFLDGLDIHVQDSFDAALNALSNAGAHIEMVALSSLNRMADLPDLHALGHISAYESWQFHQAQQALHGYGFDEYDPRVAFRIQAGQSIRPEDYQHLLQARQQWATLFAAELSPYDAVLTPTVPIVAPVMQSLLEQTPNSDALFFKTNQLLLRNPSVFNRADGCAISLPCHTDGLPVGLMLGHSHLNDGRVLTAARAVEKVLTRLRRPHQA
jgi:aspartyl-tRNA(Asn)/glutamyl-tRNA(Gln) amidotransferase subunit A